jgi:hypothetical protein
LIAAADKLVHKISRESLLPHLRVGSIHLVAEVVEIIVPLVVVVEEEDHILQVEEVPDREEAEEDNY